MSLNTGLDSPLEYGTGTWDWIIELECDVGLDYKTGKVLAPVLMLAYQTRPLLIKFAYCSRWIESSIKDSRCLTLNPGL